MRILLTGAAGFIGSHVLHQLLQHDAEIMVLLRPQTNRWRLQHDLSARVRIVEGDLLNLDQTRRQIQSLQPDLCLHLAWYTEYGTYWHSLRNLDMVRATLNLAQILVEKCHARLVGLGTCVEYDLRGGCFQEDESPLKPRSLYAASKLSVAQILEQIQQQNLLETTWLRIFYLYGPMEDKRRLVAQAINHFLDRQVLDATSGLQRRDYLHVEDVASAVVNAAFSSLRGAVNIGSGQAVEIRDMLHLLAKLMQAEDLLRLGELPERAEDPPLICADNRRLRSIGWQPSYTLEAGLEHTIAWWRAHRERNRA